MSKIIFYVTPVKYCDKKQCHCCDKLIIGASCKLTSPVNQDTRCTFVCPSCSPYGLTRGHITMDTSENLDVTYGFVPTKVM